MTAATDKALPGTLHNYAPGLTAFEHAPYSASSQGTSTQEPKNYILWLGGLFDGLCTVAYPLALHKLLSANGRWGVVQVLLSSSYTGWQTSSLDADADQLASCVAYFRSLHTQAPKIVLMGHSTGCQIATHYLVGPWRDPAIPEHTLARPPVAGVILQAGISDREAMATLGTEATTALNAGIQQARSLIADGNPDTRVRGVEPVFFGAPTAQRFLSLVSDNPAEADDDYFSSDLDDGRVQRVWGAKGLAGRGVRVMVCLSGADPYMPTAVDKEALVARWGAAVKSAEGSWDEGSGVVAGAGHNLNGNDEAIVSDLCKRVAAFVESLE